MPKDTPPSTSNSGITTLPSGERRVASSVRADGTKRREIRIRPGYQPPEDVKIYKNETAEAWRNRGSGPVPGSEGLHDEESAATGDAKSNKNAKRREARRRAKAAAAEQDGEDQAEKPDDPAPAEQDAIETTNDAAPPPEKADNDKKIRKLRKKLREARDLQEKKEKGDDLLQEQFEKVIRINELIRELDSLGIGPDGEPKS